MKITPALHLGKITHGFDTQDGQRQVLHGVDLEIPAGVTAAVLGESGAGKTTLLLIAGGLLRPLGGRVAVNGIEVYAAGDATRSRLRSQLVGFVFQRFHLLPYLSVRENVLAAACGEADSKVDSILEQIGLSARRDQSVRTLSAGECQRVALARALVNSPKLLLVDEPTGNLDPANGRRIIELLKEYTVEGGSVLVVTHDPAVACAADFRAELRDGLLQIV